jgi:hypothetical protein
MSVYRNKAWYVAILKGKDKDWAYRYITENLVRPSFVYEPQNAYAAYEEVYGCKILSPYEQQVISKDDEIRRLREALELAKIAQRQAGTEPIKEVVGQSEIEPEPDTAEAYNPTLTEDQFKAQHPEIKKGLPMHRAWEKYKKENGIA